MSDDPARASSTEAELSERIRELESTLASLRADAEIAHVLLGLSGAFAQVRSVPDTLARAVNMVPELFGADRCFATAWDSSGGRFLILAHAGFDDERLTVLRELAEKSRLPFLQIALLESLAPVLVPDVKDDERISKEDTERRGLGALIAVPIVRRGQAFGALAIEFEDPRTFGSKETALAYGVARQLSIALANARQFSLLQGLRSFGLRVGMGLRLGDVLREVADGAQRLLAGDRSHVYLVDPSNQRLVAAGPSVPPREGAGIEVLDLSEEPWDRLTRGETVVVDRETSEVSLGEGVASVVAAPVTGGRAGPLGAVLVFFNRSVDLGVDETEALSVMAAQAAMAIDNAQRFEQQRRVSRSLQQGLLATETPLLRNCKIGAVYEPAGRGADIGGDFFDVFVLGENCIGVVVGDVSGKGAEAAAQTAQAKYMLRAFAIRNARPASALYHLNNALTKGLAEDRFATCLYATYNQAESRFEVALAGHPAPLIYRAADGSVETMEIAGGLLGVFEEQNFEQSTIDLREGDAFIAYTDGLVEVRGEDGELYELERLIASIERHGGTAVGEDLARLIFQDAQRFGQVTDDTVVFVLSCGNPG